MGCRQAGRQTDIQYVIHAGIHVYKYIHIRIHAYIQPYLPT